MSTVETVIWSYLLAGLIYGVYYCYYDRKRLKADIDQVWREETPMKEAPPAIFYIQCALMVAMCLLAWPFFFVDNAIHDVEEIIRGYDVPVGPSQPNGQEDEMTSEANPRILGAQS